MFGLVVWTHLPIRSAIDATETGWEAQFHEIVNHTDNDFVYNH